MTDFYGAPPNKGGGGIVLSVVAGSGVSVDDTDPANPIVSATGSGSGIVVSVVAGSGISVDDTDPANPIVSATGGGGGVASLTGAGVTNPTGVLNQSGGMLIDDAEGDGFEVDTTAGIRLNDTGGGVLVSTTGVSGVTITSSGAGTGILIESTGGQPVYISGAGTAAVLLCAIPGDLFGVFNSTGATQAAAPSSAQDIANALAAYGLLAGAGTIGGSGYASLTGAGEATTPGDLVQLGGFTVTDAAGDGVSVNTAGGVTLANTAVSAGVSITDTSEAGISLTTSGDGGIFLTSSNATGGAPIVISQTGISNVQILGGATGAGVFIQDNGASGVQLETTLAGASISLSASGVGAINIANGGADLLGIFGAAAVAQQTVAGSLSTVLDPAAKAVITSILAALSATAGYGLVVDGTT